MSSSAAASAAAAAAGDATWGPGGRVGVAPRAEKLSAGSELCILVRVCFLQALDSCGLLPPGSDTAGRVECEPAKADGAQEEPRL